uniref:Ubiquitin-like domain-containing protein n=1 Tax=Schizaphis graminum TaxID=13262 RepID=A0A2S2NEA3_SCHGA
MDLSDEDDNPYDFVAQYRKLEKERKNKVNEPPADNKQVPVISSTKINTETSVDSKKDSSKNVQCQQSKKSTNSDVNTTVGLIPSTSGQTNAQRGSRRSKRSRSSSVPENVIGPVICIGDFCDGYNMPPPKVFNNVNTEDDTDDIFANWQKRQIEEAELEDALARANRVMNVKVYWRQMRTYTFPLRMFQSISSIYEHFAKLEDIDFSHVRLDLHKKTLSPKDTPDSINYKIVDFIDGDIEFYRSPYDTPNVPEDKEQQQDEMVTYQIKQKDVKKPIVLEMRKTDKMLIMYIKLKELLGIELDTFTLEFDGDKIKYMDTMESLDLEGNECILLYQKKSI